MIDIEWLFASLPDDAMSGDEFDLVLRRIGLVEPHDFATLDALRTAATSNGLVERDAAGRLRKAVRIPPWPTEAELLSQRAQREHDEFFADRGDYTNPARQELEAFVQGLIDERLGALEERVCEMEGHLTATV